MEWINKEVVELRKSLYATFGAVLAAVALFLAPAAAPHGPTTEPAAAVPLQDLLQAKAAAAPTEPVRVIVQAKGPPANLIRTAQELGGRMTHEWSFINGFGVQLPAGQLWTLARQPGVKWISWDSGLQADAKGSSSGDGSGGGGTGTNTNLASVYPHAVRATDVWQAGYMGTGINVAIVDSGIDHGGANEDLANRVIQSVTFSSSAQYMSDRFGHGTHVAGIAAGDGVTLNGKYIGIAPKANLLNLKFSADDGSATESDLLSALQWAYDNRSRFSIRVLNLSANSATAQSYATSPLCAAVEKLWTGGVVVVVSAGNRGKDSDAVYYPPANDPYVITVGAIDDKKTTDLADDEMPSWSSRGITQDRFAKPDILAPGVKIISTKAGDTALLIYSNKGNVIDDYYFMLGGTSMAAPMVSGAVALMLEKNPTLTPDQVKWLIINTGRDFKSMRRGDPKVLDAYAAVMYSSKLGSANAGLVGSAGGTLSGTTDSNVYWLSSVNY